MLYSSLIKAVWQKNIELIYCHTDTYMKCKLQSIFLLKLAQVHKHETLEN